MIHIGVFGFVCILIDIQLTSDWIRRRFFTGGGGGGRIWRSAVAKSARSRPRIVTYTEVASVTCTPSRLRINWKRRSAIRGRRASVFVALGAILHGLAVIMSGAGATAGARVMRARRPLLPPPLQPPPPRCRRTFSCSADRCRRRRATLLPSLTRGPAAQKSGGKVDSFRKR